MDLRDLPSGPPVPGFDGAYGLRYDAVSGDEVRAHVEVGVVQLQPFGLVHGGVYAAMAESMASVGTAVGAADAQGQRLVAGMSNNTSFLRPSFEGSTLRATARPIHRGRTTWVWDVEVTGPASMPLAVSRVTIAIRPGVAKGPTVKPAA